MLKFCSSGFVIYITFCQLSFCYKYNNFAAHRIQLSELWSSRSGALVTWRLVPGYLAAALVRLALPLVIKVRFAPRNKKSPA